MAAEVVAKILSIGIDEENGGYIVHFWVGQEFAENPTLNEAFALLGSMDSLQREVYSFLVQWEDGEFTMEPDEELSECLAIFDRYEDANDLEGLVARQWKTGQMAEAIVTHLVNANVFGVWRTTEPEEQEPPLERNV